MLMMVPATLADQEFCFEVFASTRGAAALATEYQERESYYRLRCPQAQRMILLCRGARAGTALICRRPHEVRLMDLAVLPAYRGQGIGTALIRGLQAEAGSAQLSLSLQVKRTNRARHLYARLGFVKTSETPTHLSMVWRQ